MHELSACMYKFLFCNQSGDIENITFSGENIEIVAFGGAELTPGSHVILSKHKTTSETLVKLLYLLFLCVHCSVILSSNRVSFRLYNVVSVA